MGLLATALAVVVAPQDEGESPVIIGRFTGNGTTHKHRSRGMGLLATVLAVVVAPQDEGCSTPSLQMGSPDGRRDPFNTRYDTPPR